MYPSKNANWHLENYISKTVVMKILFPIRAIKH